MLRYVSYFKGLSETDLAAVNNHVFEKKAARGDIIVFESEPSDAIYYVNEGVVKAYKTSADGKEQILRIIRPGDTFNDVPILGGVNLATAEAMSPVVLYGIKKKDVEAMTHDYPQIAKNIIRVLSQRVEEMVDLIEDFSFRRVNGRVAKILLENAGNGGKPRLTQQEMAAMIGTAREMVGRSFKSLEAEGAIRLEHSRIVIANRAVLLKIAGLSE